MGAFFARDPHTTHTVGCPSTLPTLGSDGRSSSSLAFLGKKKGESRAFQSFYVSLKREKREIHLVLWSFEGN